MIRVYTRTLTADMINGKAPRYRPTPMLISKEMRALRVAVEPKTRIAVGRHRTCPKPTPARLRRHFLKEPNQRINLRRSHTLIIRQGQL